MATTTAASEPESQASVALATPPPSPSPAWAAAPAAKTRAAGKAALGPSDAASFGAAKSLYDAGRYAEALPQFEAMAASNPEADLYAARCTARLKGCDAAASRYDSLAQKESGTASGSRASLEIARCYKNAGQASAARSRYEGLTTDSYVAKEASADLAALDTPRASARPAKPMPAATASSLNNTR
jgi:thioredoxin-like negative regulator of GroEL